MFQNLTDEMVRRYLFVSIIVLCAAAVMVAIVATVSESIFGMTLAFIVLTVACLMMVLMFSLGGSE